MYLRSSWVNWFVILSQRSVFCFPCCIGIFCHLGYDVIFDHWPTNMNIRDLRRIFPAIKLQAYRRRSVLSRKAVDVHCCFPHLSGGFGCPQTFSILSSHNLSRLSSLISLCLSVASVVCVLCAVYVVRHAEKSP